MATGVTSLLLPKGVIEAADDTVMYAKEVARKNTLPLNDVSSACISKSNCTLLET